MIPLKEHPRGLVVKIFVQPRSSRNAVVGLHGDALKIKLAAPPVDGAANKKCIDYLAKCMKIPKSSIEMLSGQSSRTKQLLFCFQKGHAPEDERDRLTGLLTALLPQ